MATIILNLSIEKEVAERIQRYAASRNTSVSSIGENFFSFISILLIEDNEQ
ncbi:MAG: DUF6364 family protein [Candidatus Azobacteroides sp.]|nr:DUF6364 family protein [Candidatus Azobacteroides sp.]